MDEELTKQALIKKLRDALGLCKDSEEEVDVPLKQWELQQLILLCGRNEA